MIHRNRVIVSGCHLISLTVCDAHVWRRRMYFTPTARLPAIGSWHSAHGATIVLGHPECPFTIADTGI